MVRIESIHHQGLIQNKGQAVRNEISKCIFTYYHMSIYVSKSVSKLQIQVANHVFELSAGNCHR